MELAAEQKSGAQDALSTSFPPCGVFSIHTWEGGWVRLQLTFLLALTLQDSPERYHLTLKTQVVSSQSPLYHPLLSLPLSHPGWGQGWVLQYQVLGGRHRLHGHF